jgi:hypothetical protein
VIAAWRTTADVFVFFNNDWEGFAVENARELAARMGASEPSGAPSS